MAEDDDRLVGFIHVVFDHDPRWGSLVDNLHVARDRQRTGVGTALLAHAARAVVEHARADGMYLWVLEQNTAAQQFYRARGARHVETAPVSPPGGDRSRLNGSPRRFRMAWPAATAVSDLDVRLEHRPQTHRARAVRTTRGRGTAGAMAAPQGDGSSERLGPPTAASAATEGGGDTCYRH